MSDPLPDPFEFMKKLWNPMGLPMPGMVAPTLDIGAVEKKIADLKSVENWLNLNLNMLRLSIQGLEMQRSTLAAIKAMQPAQPGAGAEASKNPFSDPTAWWSMMQKAAASATAAKPPEAKAAEVMPAETKSPETKSPETKSPETKSSKTKSTETKPAEAKSPKTKSPKTKSTETKPAEAKLAEAKPTGAAPAKAKPK